ncbi:hypothetical protein SRHO_G00025820 [Serrasalmus rhombeus]
MSETERRVGVGGGGFSLTQSEAAVRKRGGRDVKKRCETSNMAPLLTPRCRVKTGPVRMERAVKHYLKSLLSFSTCFL